jgi:hypothetical protein
MLSTRFLVGAMGALISLGVSAVPALAAGCSVDCTVTWTLENSNNINGGLGMLLNDGTLVTGTVTFQLDNYVGDGLTDAQSLSTFGTLPTSVYGTYTAVNLTSTYVGTGVGNNGQIQNQLLPAQGWFINNNDYNPNGGTTDCCADAQTVYLSPVAITNATNNSGSNAPGVPDLTTACDASGGAPDPGSPCQVFAIIGEGPFVDVGGTINIQHGTNGTDTGLCADAVCGTINPIGLDGNGVYQVAGENAFWEAPYTGSATPEPSTFVLIGSSLLAVGFGRKRFFGRG